MMIPKNWLIVGMSFVLCMQKGRVIHLPTDVFSTRLELKPFCPASHVLNTTPLMRHGQDAQRPRYFLPPSRRVVRTRAHRFAALLYTALRSRLPTATTTTINTLSRTSYTRR